MIDYIFGIFSKPYYMITLLDALIVLGMVILFLFAGYGLYCVSSFVCIEFKKAFKKLKSKNKKDKGE